MTIQTHASILKRQGDISTNEYETSVIDFNGVPLSISFIRTLTGSVPTAIRVRNMIGGAVIAEKPWTGGLGCAIVIAGEIHIFGSTNWSATGNSLIHSVLAPDFTPSAPVTILTIPGSHLMNTDVCFDGTNYVFAVEVINSTPHPGLSYYKTADFSTFTLVKSGFNAGGYCACPSIDFIDGKYFVTFLANAGGTYVTVSTRSADLLTWNPYGGADAFLAPDASIGEGCNASDISMAECGGIVYGTYLTGDQSTWMHRRTFVYLGTLSQLKTEFFPI